MTYETTPIKPTKGLGKKTVVKAAEGLSTFTLMGIIIKRHKVGLLIASNLTFVVLHLFPFVPELLLSVI